MGDQKQSAPAEVKARPLSLVWTGTAVANAPSPCLPTLDGFSTKRLSKDYHQLSHSEIGDGKRIYQHLCGPTRFWPQFQCKLWKAQRRIPQHRTDFPHLQGKRSKAPSKFCSVAL